MPHTRKSDKEITEIIKKNMNDICSKRGTKREIARLCNCSEALVTKWCNYASDTIPSAADLHTIAKYADVSMEWFFRQTNEDNNIDGFTYSQLFTRLRQLIALHIIDPVNVKDEILRYLLLRNHELQHSGMCKAKLNEWQYTISQKFNIPFSNFSLSPKLYEKAITKYKDIKEASDDDTYCNLAKTFNDSDTTTQIIFKLR